MLSKGTFLSDTEKSSLEDFASLELHGGGRGGRAGMKQQDFKDQK